MKTINLLVMCALSTGVLVPSGMAGAIVGEASESAMGRSSLTNPFFVADDSSVSWTNSLAYSFTVELTSIGPDTSMRISFKNASGIEQDYEYIGGSPSAPETSKKFYMQPGWSLSVKDVVQVDPDEDGATFSFTIS
jgi:hypothetical protein